MKQLNVKNKVVDNQHTKICVPITAVSQSEIITSIKEIKQTPADLVEWRCDYYEDCKDVGKVVETLKLMDSILGDLPLIFTFRTVNEGGQCDIAMSEYLLLYKTAILSKTVNFVDIEVLRDDAIVNNITKHAKQAGVYVIFSHHDFDSTPPKDKIVNRLKLMQLRGADISKVAYMPRSEQDVVAMVDAAYELKQEDMLYIIVSMGALGKRTRIEANELGSCITFASWKQESAPGQVNITELFQLLNT